MTKVKFISNIIKHHTNRNHYTFYTTLYGKLYSQNWPRCVISPLRVLIRTLANIILKITGIHPVGQVKNVDVVVSLTSYPARIKNIWMVISSILAQSYCPKLIILWLSKEQFLSKRLPKRLTDLQSERFKIVFVEGDIRSHKKYLYAFMKFPEKIIITVDDDVIYSNDIVKCLYESYLSSPDAIHANHTAQISFDNGSLKPYMEWELIFHKSISPDQLQIGMGGVLYPPRLLYKDVLNIDLATRLAPMADDIWLNSMARLNNTSIIRSEYDKASQSFLVYKVRRTL